MTARLFLVSGAAGFIGSHVCDRLLDEGDSVVGLDNLNDAYDVRLKEWRLKSLLARPGFEFVHADICDSAGLHRLISQLEPVSAVLNLAARAGVRQSIIDPEGYYETNVTGTLNLLELCSKNAIPKFVLASSSSLYGDSKGHPCQEEAGTDRPLSPYAASKKAAETLSFTYHHLNGLDVSILRYFTVYGPAGRPDMSPFRFVKWVVEGYPVRVYGDGTQSRDFTHVKDIARGTVAALKSVGYEIINLGSGSPLKLRSFLSLIEKAAEKKAVVENLPKHAADVSKTWADTKKARQLLRWHAQESLESGVRELVDWYRANRDWAQDIKE